MKAPERIQEIFAQALERKSRAEREKYLAEACQGDPELRREIESLLRAGEQAGDFLRPTIKETESDFASEKAGTIIGRYKLLEQIGEGGFGVVWMAEQEKPVRRRVALKIIKLGMDTKEVVARFEAERQALAMMDHPNIASVFDGGAADTGRPYFVMELVKGVPITDYCDASKLTTRERLELFMQVCQAVQHAHQKGIIHRDLKPSNILVTVKDDRPVPKVIDFGVAKALGQKLTEKTLFTGFHHMIGTPAYMSPEQAEPSGRDVDTRADVYSLGVLLYELLTGVTPFDKDSLAKAALDEFRRMIRETDPPKPSTRLQALGTGLAEVARRRQVEPATLRRLVRGDLDWIVMTCLDKDRFRRYEAAAGLATDVQRYLSNIPVAARPPTAAYRLAKFLRRHRQATTVVGAVLLTLLLVGAGVFCVGQWPVLAPARTQSDRWKPGYGGTSATAVDIRGQTGSGASVIFDGENLEGWEGDTLGVFRITDHAIVGGSLAQTLPENVYLCTTRRYTNFILRLEFRLLGTNSLANAGVQFRSRRVAGSQEVSGYQADIGEGYWGSLYDQSRRDTVLAAANQTAISAVLKPNEWNTYVIHAQGARLRFWINGYPTIDYTEADDSIPRDGIIGLQIHAGGAVEASFRHISIEVLP